MASSHHQITISTGPIPGPSHRTDMYSSYHQITISTGSFHRTVLIEEIQDIKRDIENLLWQVDFNKNKLQETVEKLENMNLEEQKIELRIGEQNLAKKYYRHKIWKDKQYFEEEEKKNLRSLKKNLRNLK